MARVMIGIPMHKGEICSATMVSVNQAQMVTKHRIDYQMLGLSLLAKNFNLLFINAIKMGYDYFCLHHSDLGCVGLNGATNNSWVDAMVDIMERLGLKAIAATVPIKCDQGSTSAGIETVKGDPWSLRRMTIKESNRLPEIVLREDLIDLWDLEDENAGSLLINTGLCIMDIRDKGGVWREKKWPGFHIFDEIAWDLDGIPESFTIPEDWNMSAWCFANDVPFATTRKPVIQHVGIRNFVNGGDWGMETEGPNRTQLNPRDYEKSSKGKLLTI